MLDSSVIENIGALTALAEGFISFFSPCVIPLLPIYLGYLSGSLEEEKPSRKKSLLFTVTFIVGIFVALMLLNISITSIRQFFQSADVWFMRIGGILIVLLGLIQLGVFKISLLERTLHIQYDFNKRRMNLVLAFIMGFTFSFSWTPCIGPALASILIMASGSGDFLQSTFLVSCYAIGFSFPFLVISFFSKQATMFFRKHELWLQAIVKVGAIILIVMGIVMSCGGFRVISGGSASEDQSQEDSAVAIPFTLSDQNGQFVSLSDFKGKILYMNFWGTWCGVCRDEIEAIQALHDKYKDSDDIAVITIVYPNGGQETDTAGILEFINEHQITFPVLFDESGELFMKYGIYSFPTVFVINKDQTVFGYLSGGIDLATMENILKQVRDSEGKPEN